MKPFKCIYIGLNVLITLGVLVGIFNIRIRQKELQPVERILYKGWNFGENIILLSVDFI